MPTFILVYGFVGGKYTSTDLSGVYSLVRLRIDRGFYCEIHSPQWGLIQSCQRWENMLWKSNILLYHLYLTLIFLELEVMDLMKKVKRVMHPKIVFSKSLDVVFKRICHPKRISGTSYYPFPSYTCVIYEWASWTTIFLYFCQLFFFIINEWNIRW
jgi:hypothetical protein